MVQDNLCKEIFIFSGLELVSYSSIFCIDIIVKVPLGVDVFVSVDFVWVMITGYFTFNSNECY